MKKSKTKKTKKTKKSLGAGTMALLIGISAVVLLAAVYYLSNFQTASSNNNNSNSNNSSPEKYAYKVGQPDAGKIAPNFKLSGTDGKSFELSDFRGQTVLLFFQEGINCQPCWDQLRDIESTFDQFKALGVDRVVTISNDPLDALKQKVELEKLGTPALSDPSLKVSETYTTNLYGMMGNQFNGHSFIVVGPDGVIKWRADYGGGPDYTMYVPVQTLISDMSKGLKKEG